VQVEGMACARPVIAVHGHGPAEIVRDGETGWLVAPDDRDALTAALVEAVNHPAERRRRGEAARRDALARFAWPALARRVAAVYDDVAT
jgi:glycosyltransferase involved in cell wall biosynthesis